MFNLRKPLAIGLMTVMGGAAAHMAYAQTTPAVKDIVIVHGNEPGVDASFAAAAKELGITGRVFSDAGLATDSGLPKTDSAGNRLVLDSTNIRASAGVGLSWKSPFGPIRIDLATPVVKEPGDVKELFRFGFGTRF